MKGLIRDILTFLRELQENNDRGWFAGQNPLSEIERGVR